MHIGINCLRIYPAFFGGLNAYTIGLLDGFAATGNGHRFCLYITHANQDLFARYGSQPNFEMVVLDDRSLSLRKTLCRAALLPGNQRLYMAASNLVFEDIRAMMDADSDILYTPSTVLQSFNCRKPTVLSMHDIQHVHYPKFFSWSRRLSRRITYGLSARFANYFQASSEFIRGDMLVHFPEISTSQIEVIPEGVNVQEFSAPRETSTLATCGRIPERFLFYPAQLWPHKNHLTVLKALKQIEIQWGLKIPLVMTGARYSAAPAVFKFVSAQSMENVHYLGTVPFQDMVELYQRAAFLISAGLYESNSLPVLEAAAAGTPILASRIPPNEELAHRLHLNMFNPLDEQELARLIHTLWHDEKTAADQIAHNRRNIPFYSWENAARKYLNLFGRAVNS
jgi:glycosyltransferase involved in cell wall biosynthesis